MKMDLVKWVEESIRLSRQAGYSPGRFEAMWARQGRTRDGLIVVMTQLVESGEIKSGLKRMKDLGLLEWSIESGVIKFASEFKPRTVDSAKWLLGQIEGRDPEADD